MTNLERRFEDALQAVKESLQKEPTPADQALLFERHCSDQTHLCLFYAKEGYNTIAKTIMLDLIEDDCSDFFGE